MNNLPIGIFDSGIGGLTAVTAIHNIMPKENIIYFGDTKNMPYGDKDISSILYFTKQNIKFLKSCKVKLILAACGTISSYIKLVDSNVFGVIEPVCNTAINLTSNKKIGIIGTKASIESNSYLKYISALNSSINCYQQACPLLAPMIEKGYYHSNIEELKSILRLYISPLIQKDIDTLILGCTHYPIVSDIIRELFGSQLNIVDPGKEAAISIKNLLKEKNLTSNKHLSDKYYVSSDKENFIRNAKIFLNKDISSQSYEITDFKGR